jgi:putative CocE/NonD family hydrolase
MPTRLIVERDVMIPMRDAIRLAADVYRPADERRSPVLVTRTPYGKSTAINVASRIFNPLDAVSRGYAVVIQDVRGRFTSEGEWQPFANEVADSHDTVEWAGTQPWSNGSVGIYGGSYVGVTALHAVISDPPHLKACMVQALSTNFHDCWTYSGGAFELGFNLFWVAGPFWGLAWDAIKRMGASGAEAAELQAGLARIAADPVGACRHLPVRDLPAFRRTAGYWREWLSHPAYDDYWKKLDVTTRDVRVRVPVLNVTGWFDLFLRGGLHLHEFLASHSDERVAHEHRLVIGPWEHVSHLNLTPSSAGQWDFGPEAISGPRSWTALTLDFFDRWLKDAAEAPPGARVRYFVMGENQWRGSDAWPPRYTPVKYFLHSAGAANTRAGNGTLSTTAPADEPPDSYRYDPADPVPSVGGRTLFYHPVLGPAGVFDQAKVEERDDVLVYTTPRLVTPLRIAGPVSVTLFASSSAVDTDFTAKLVDVQPDGYCANLAEGIVRARYRNSLEKEEFLEPGTVYELRIDLWSVAHCFDVGRRVRLEISSSNFPRYDRNLNSDVSPSAGLARDMQVAVQQVFHRADGASHLTLPVVPSRVGARPDHRDTGGDDGD